MAPVVTAAVVGAGVIAAGSVGDQDPVAAQEIFSGAVTLPGDVRRASDAQAISRSADRTETVQSATTPVKSLKVVPTRATGKRWTTTALNLWSTPSEGSKLLGEVEEAKRVAISGRKVGDFAEILVHRKPRWVKAEYLAKEKPTVLEGISGDSCPDTASAESGLVPDAVRVHRAVCNVFPQISQYGGWDGHGEHSSGRAIDIMTSDEALGTEIAEFLRAHASELNLYDVIWRQHIWTPERGGEGWRSMSDRGSSTANHMDHVHVSVN